MSEIASPGVSVIVPVYNAAAYVEATLEALITQTVAPSEIIVVDDASTDGSALIVQAVATRSSVVPVRLVRNPASLGVAAARNVGASLATSDWLGFCDNDDLWHPRYIELMLGQLEADADALAMAAEATGFAVESERADLSAHQRLGMVAHWVPDDAAVVSHLSLSCPLPPRPVTRTVSPDDLRRESVFSTTQVMYRRDAFLIAGGFAGWSYQADDWILNGTIAERRPISMLRAPLVYYRVRASSQSHVMVDSYLSIMITNLALRFGGKRPDSQSAGDLFTHQLTAYAAAGGSIARVLGLALLGGCASPRMLARLIKRSARARLRPRAPA